MTAPELAALEALFAAEIGAGTGETLGLCRIPKRIADRLIAQGMIEPYTYTLGRDALGPITVPGYALTHLGRMTYCATCSDEEDAAS